MVEKIQVRCGAGVGWLENSEKEGITERGCQGWAGDGRRGVSSEAARVGGVGRCVTVLVRHWGVPVCSFNPIKEQAMSHLPARRKWAGWRLKENGEG